jgi:hypothetical protein
MKINETILLKVMFYKCPETSETQVAKLMTRYHKDVMTGVLVPKHIMIYDCVLNDRLISNREITNIKSKQRLTEIILDGIPPIAEDQSYSIEIIDDEIHIRIYKNETIDMIQYIAEQLGISEHQYECIYKEYNNLIQAIELIKKYKITTPEKTYDDVH